MQDICSFDLQQQTITHLDLFSSQWALVSMYRDSSICMSPNRGTTWSCEASKQSLQTEYYDEKKPCFHENQTVCLHLKELVDFAEVYPFLCVQLIDVADISIHQVQAKTHDLKHRAIPSFVKFSFSRVLKASAGMDALTFSSMCFSLGVKYILFSQ